MRRLLGTLLETAQVRLDLVAVEIELEKQRLLTVLLLAVLGLLLATVGLVLAAALLVLAVAPPYRWAVLAVLSQELALGGAHIERIRAGVVVQAGQPGIGDGVHGHHPGQPWPLAQHHRGRASWRP